MIASLKGRSLFRVRTSAGRVVFAEPIKIGQRIRNVHNHGNGTLVIRTARRKIFIIHPKKREQTVIPSEIRGTFKSCLTCHSGNLMAPDLKGVFGRKIGESDFQDYSKALSKSWGHWNERNLKKYLLNPQKTFPGTVMPDPNLDENTAQELVEFLKSY